MKKLKKMDSKVSNLGTMVKINHVDTRNENFEEEKVREMNVNNISFSSYNNNHSIGRSNRFIRQVDQIGSSQKMAP